MLSTFKENLGPASLKRRALQFWDATKYYAGGLYRNIDEDHCFMFASGIAFDVLYCIIPLSLVLLDVFSFILRSDERATTLVVTYLANAIPVEQYRTSAVQWMQENLLNHEAGLDPVAGFIGGFTLIWLGSMLFSSLRTSLNAIFKLKPRSNMVALKILDFFVMLLVMVLLLTMTFISPIIGLLRRIGSNFLRPEVYAYIDGLIPYFLSLAVTFLLFTLLFRMLPYERLQKKVVAVSVATTLFLVEVMKYIVAFYLEKVSSIGTLYGTYAFAVGIAIWIYYVGVVFTIGAEVGWLYQERKKQLGELPVESEEVVDSAFYEPALFFEKG